MAAAGGAAPATGGPAGSAGPLHDLAAPPAGGDASAGAGHIRRRLRDEGASLWRSSAILGVALVLALGLLATIWLLARPLAMLAAAVVLAQAVEPAIERAERRLPRGAAVGLAYGGLLAVFAGLLWLVVPSLLRVARDAAVHAPAILDGVRVAMRDWDPVLVQGANEVAESVGDGLAPALAEVPSLLVRGGVSALLIVVMAAYWSLAAPDLRRFSFSFVPTRHRALTSDVASEVVATMGGYVRVRAISALAVAAAIWLGLWALGVDHAATLALVAGLGDLVPFVGPAVAIVPALAVALIDGPTTALLVLGLYVAVQQVKSHLLSPLLMRHQAAIPPLIVIFALVVGGSVGGVIGALVATPLAGALRVVIVRVIAPAVRRRLREDDHPPAAPTADATPASADMTPA